MRMTASWFGPNGSTAYKVAARRYAPDSELPSDRSDHPRTRRLLHDGVANRNAGLDGNNPIQGVVDSGVGCAVTAREVSMK